MRYIWIILGLLLFITPLLTAQEPPPPDPPTCPISAEVEGSWDGSQWIFEYWINTGCTAPTYFTFHYALKRSGEIIDTFDIYEEDSESHGVNFEKEFDFESEQWDVEPQFGDQMLGVIMVVDSYVGPPTHYASDWSDYITATEECPAPAPAPTSMLGTHWTLMATTLGLPLVFPQEPPPDPPECPIAVEITSGYWTCFGWFFEVDITFGCTPKTQIDYWWKLKRDGEVLQMVHEDAGDWGGSGTHTFYPYIPWDSNMFAYTLLTTDSIQLWCWAEDEASPPHSTEDTSDWVSQ